MIEPNESVSTRTRIMLQIESTTEECLRVNRQTKRAKLVEERVN